MDLGQNTLFGSKIIKSISYDEQEIIKDIIYLHGNGNYIDCDPTYSIGNFYNDKLPKPKYRFDKFPQVAGVDEADSSKLPLEDQSCNVIMFDPPFVMGASDNEKE